jgi:hypothetical protein
VKLNPKPAVGTARASLEDRIKAHWRELERLIDEEAALQAKSAAGVPAVALKQNLLIRGGCLCSSMMHIIEDRKKAAALVERQANESKQSKSA